MRCINGLSCVIQYSHGMLEVRALVTILSLFDAPSLLNISMRAEVSTLRKVVIRNKHWWDVPENEHCTNTGIVNLSQSFGYCFILTQSCNQINTSSDPKQQWISTFHVYQVLFQPSLQQVRLVTNSPSPWTKKKKRLDAQVLYNWIWCLSTCW